MRKLLATLVAVLALALVVAAPAFAGTPDTTGASGAGEFFGQHHADMASMDGFTGDMNPGVHHHGFSNWDPNMPTP